MVIKNAVPPLSKEEQDGIIDRAIFYGSKKERNLMEEVREWILSTSGNFLSTEVLRSLHLSTRNDDKNLSIILKRLCDQGVIEKYGNKRGSWRTVESNIQKIDWESVDSSKVLNINYPFGVEKYYLTFPKDVIIVAGSKDAGKTAFCLCFAMLNMDLHKINYFSSELGAFKLQARLNKFPINIQRWKAINFIQRMDRFEDVIFPNEINIIDYIDCPEDAWRIVTPIREIFKKLDQGIAIIALQRPSNRKIARGGEGTLDRASLYLSMGKGLIEIITCKNWVDDTVNPSGLSLEYKLAQGCIFTKQSEWSIPWEDVKR